MTLEKFRSPVMKKMILRIQFSFLFCLHTYFILCFSLFLAYVQKKDPGQWLKKKRKTKGSFENVWRNAFDWNKTWLLWAKLLIYFTDFFFSLQELMNYENHIHFDNQKYWVQLHWDITEKLVSFLFVFMYLFVYWWRKK